MTQSLIGLGANLGNKEETVLRAVELIDRHFLQVEKTSKIFATDPVGGPGNQEVFANAALLANSDHSPREILQKLLEIEKEFGRHRDIRWQARELDLDLLLYGEEILTDLEYIVPHPRMSFRRFVLEPAAEVAPEMLHPIANKTVAELLGSINQPFNLIGICSENQLAADKLAELVRDRSNIHLVSLDQLGETLEETGEKYFDSKSNESFMICPDFQDSKQICPKLTVGMINCDRESPDQLQQMAKKNLFPNIDGPYLILNIDDLATGADELVAAIHAMQ